MGLFSKVLDKYSSNEEPKGTNTAPAAQNTAPEEEYTGPERRIRFKTKDRYADLCLATTALSVYAAAADGTITIEEYMEMDINAFAINKKGMISNEVMEKVKDLYDKHNITWEEVVTYLDKLSFDELLSMEEDLSDVINASDGISEEEEQVVRQFNTYVNSRK